MSLPEKPRQYLALPGDDLDIGDVTLPEGASHNDIFDYRSNRTVTRRQYVVTVSALGTVILLLFGSLSVVALRGTSTTSESRLSAAFVPSGVPILRTFEDTLAFGGHRSNFTDAHWDALIPPGGGFITVPDPTKYGLPNDDRGNASLWGVSVFHQLHCVSMLRRIYWNDRSGRQMDPEFLDHAAHCFHFLRQAISCWSDTTLEMPQMRGKDGNVTRATYASPRLCRDFDAIHRYTALAYEEAQHA